MNTIVLTYNPMAGAISCSLDTANDLDTDDERSKIHKDIFEGSRLILLCVCISFPLSFYLTISFFFWGFGKIAPENHSDTPRPVHFHIGIKAVAGLILRSVDKKISKHKKKGEVWWVNGILNRNILYICMYIYISRICDNVFVMIMYFVIMW